MSRRDIQLARRLIAQRQQQPSLPVPTLDEQLAELERQYEQTGCPIERGHLYAQYSRLKCGRVIVGDSYWVYELGLDPRARSPKPDPAAKLYRPSARQPAPPAPHPPKEG